MTAFTIGSCFAREIEKKLTMLEVPTANVTFPENVAPGRGGRVNSIINEFNPGSISQRIGWAIDGIDTREFHESIFLQNGKGQDLLLAKGNALQFEELLDIRKTIDDLYSSLQISDVLIITLGMTQCWVDNETGHFLNRMPGPREIKKEPNRFVCRFLTLQECTDLLGNSLDYAFKNGLKHVILTVSPVPLQQTFIPIDCAIANCLSKSTLRLAANELVNSFPERIDYFPSYEIVSSGGLHAFIDDHIHVKSEVVSQVTNHMMTHYITE